MGLEEFQESVQRKRRATSPTSLARQLESSLQVAGQSQPKLIRTIPVANQRLALLRTSRDPLRTSGLGRRLPTSGLARPGPYAFDTPQAFPSSFQFGSQPMDTNDEDSSSSSSSSS